MVSRLAALAPQPARHPVVEVRGALATSLETLDAALVSRLAALDLATLAEVRGASYEPEPPDVRSWSRLAAPTLVEVRGALATSLETTDDAAPWFRGSLARTSTSGDTTRWLRCEERSRRASKPPDARSALVSRLAALAPQPAANRGTVEFWLVTATDEKPTATRWSGLSRTADGQQVPSAVERARGYLTGLRPSERAVGWLAPISVTLLAFALRMYHLGTPKRFAFDETYYAKDAWSLLNNGYAQTYLTDVDGNTKNKIDDDILAGHVNDVWTGDPSMAVHPEVGKWLIALGEKAFGMDPFGWRIASAVVGALMVLVMCRLLRRMTGSTVLGCIGGLLLSFDGLQFVLSRLALLDIFLAFFILCAVALPGRRPRRYRRRLARRAPDDEDDRPGVVGPGARPAVPPVAAGQRHLLRAGDRHQVDGDLPAGGVRRAWCGSGAPARGARFGVRWPIAKSALVDGVPAFVHLVIVAGARLHRDVGRLAGSRRRVRGAPQRHAVPPVHRARPLRGGRRLLRRDRPRREQALATADEKDASGIGEAWQSLRSLWYYHQDVYTFHTHFLKCSTHTYQSKPSSWLLLNRPVGVAVNNDIEPAGRDVPDDRGSAARRGLRRARGQRLHPAGAADRHPDDLVGRHASRCCSRSPCGSARATGGSASPSSARCRPGCRGCSTTTGRSSTSTRSRSCRSS